MSTNIGFLLFDYYNNPGHKDHGKLCILLGRKYSQIDDLYTFIGGSSDGYKGDWDALQAIVLQQLGLILNKNAFSACLLDRIRLNNVTYFGCKITGISVRKWKIMMLCRNKKQHYLDSIKYFPINELIYNEKISLNVKTILPLIYMLTKKEHIYRPIHYTTFSICNPTNKDSYYIPILH